MVDLATPQALNEQLPDVGSDEMRDELWKFFDAQPEEMEKHHEDFGGATAKVEYDEDYNPQHMIYHNRGLTGFENNARAKTTFVELEYWIEDVVGKKRIKEMQVKPYKGQPKKW